MIFVENAKQNDDDDDTQDNMDDRNNEFNFEDPSDYDDDDFPDDGDFDDMEHDGSLPQDNVETQSTSCDLNISGDKTIDKQNHIELLRKETQTSERKNLEAVKDIDIQLVEMHQETEAAPTRKINLKQVKIVEEANNSYQNSTVNEEKIQMDENRSNILQNAADDKTNVEVSSKHHSAKSKKAVNPLKSGSIPNSIPTKSSTQKKDEKTLPVPRSKKRRILDSDSDSEKMTEVQLNTTLTTDVIQEEIVLDNVTNLSVVDEVIENESPKRRPGRKKNTTEPIKTELVVRKSPTPCDSADDTIRTARSSRKRRIVDSDSSSEDRPLVEVVLKRKSNTNSTNKSVLSKNDVSKNIKKESKEGKTSAKEIMKSFLNEQKAKIMQRSSSNKKESEVPYDEIVEIIMVSQNRTKMGRISQQRKELMNNEKLECRRQLEALKFFRCGNCKSEIQKDKWKKHLTDNNGTCWMEEFEPPMNFDDFNDCLRRIVAVFKHLSITSIQCSKCDEIKKSALGHLSHIIICNETAEVVDRRKITCEFCKERILPFHATFHRTKCLGLKPKDKIKIEEPVEEDSNAEYSITGRLKRTATKT